MVVEVGVGVLKKKWGGGCLRKGCIGVGIDVNSREKADGMLRCIRG